MTIYKTFNIEVSEVKFTNFVQEMVRQLDENGITVTFQELYDHPAVRKNFEDQCRDVLNNSLNSSYGVYPAQIVQHLYGKEIFEIERQRVAAEKQKQLDVEKNGEKIAVPVDKYRKARTLLIAAGIITAQEDDVDLDNIFYHHSVDKDEYDDNDYD